MPASIHSLKAVGVGWTFQRIQTAGGCDAGADVTVAMQKMPAGALVELQPNRDLAHGLASLLLRARALVGARPAHPSCLNV